MKKVVRLTESDLSKLVKRVLIEQEKQSSFMDKLSSINFDLPNAKQVLKKMVLFPIEMVLGNLPPVMMGKVAYFLFKNKDSVPEISACIQQTKFQFPKSCGGTSNFQSGPCISSLKQTSSQLGDLYSCIKGKMK